MRAVTASHARHNLFPIIEEVAVSNDAYHITSRHGTVVLISEREYESLLETIDILRDPFTAKELFESREQSRRGEFIKIENLDEFLDDSEAYARKHKLPGFEGAAE